MLNFSNISDIEFEYLCKDVMSRMLSIDFERFGSGPDKGIDLTDNAALNNTVVQVKHYIKTDVKTLIRDLKKELPKVDAINPKQYYICCSKELTPLNKEEIYDLFSGYMKSTANIVSAIEINDFLEMPENADLLRKHYKLWLQSANVLEDFLTNDIFIDSEVLLSDIKKEAGLFVQTSAYKKAISVLEMNNAILIVGNPGVGKSFLSKMLVLEFASRGYRVRYTTDGSNINELKRSLAQSPEVKEIILLDDCFGQAYFNMKESQGRELATLVKYCNARKNKKLIMNSRVAIFNDAKRRTMEVEKLFDDENSAYVINVEDISLEEKALILYNHLYFYEVPSEYIESFRQGKKYRKIVTHRNYNPRIIEYFCTPKRVNSVLAKEYSNFALGCLDNPVKVWNSEYEDRLLEPERRLLTVVYSLTETYTDYDYVRKCYDHYIKVDGSIDQTINQFERCLERLNGSMVSIYDVKGERMIGLANPSINDYLRDRLSTNTPELNQLLNYSCSVDQFRRLLPEPRNAECLASVFKDHSVLTYVFENDGRRDGFITWYCAVNAICDSAYKECIVNYIKKPSRVQVAENNQIWPIQVFSKLFNPDFAMYYQLDILVRNPSIFITLAEGLDLEELADLIGYIAWMFDEAEGNAYAEVLRSALVEAAEIYCSDVPVDIYDLDIAEILQHFAEQEEYGISYDFYAAGDYIEHVVEDIVREELAHIQLLLPEFVDPDGSLFDDIEVSTRGGYSLAQSYMEFEPDYKTEDNEFYADGITQGGVDIIDYIFRCE